MGDLFDKSQKQWMKNLWISYKQNNVPESLWNRVSEIVNFYNSDMTGVKEEVQVPVGADCTLSPIVPRDAATESAIKKLVCSPDLPVFEETPTSSSPDSTYQCTYCNKTFPQKNTYQNHLRSHTKDGEDPYQCNICGKTFAVPARLTRHYRTHTGEKPYMCEYCNKSFSVKENLSVHRRIHTKERPYKCDICDRAFEHSGKLHRHMRIHTGERPHKCNICSKTFIQSGQLVIHMRTHTGEKPYVCKVCTKGFTCSKQLKVHTRTHTGEKPYNCDICGKSFGYNHVLKLHQVAHYGEKVYKCTICNETFTSKKTMELHIKSHSDQTTTRASGSDASEVSCGSSTSDKENKECDPEVRQPAIQGESLEPVQEQLLPPVISTELSDQKHPNMRELCYYLYYPRARDPQQTTQQGVNPALLAAAAAAAASESDSLSPLRIVEDDTFETSTTSPLPIEPSVYLCPDPLATMQRRATVPYAAPSPVYLTQLTEPEKQAPVLTPPSSNPVSPAPSPSPDPVDLVPEVREVLSLPPRKRSKMILESLEYASKAPSTSRLRQSSVIQFAHAPSLQQKS